MVCVNNFFDKKIKASTCSVERFDWSSLHPVIRSTPKQTWQGGHSTNELSQKAQCCLFGNLYSILLQSADYIINFICNFYSLCTNTKSQKWGCSLLRLLAKLGQQVNIRGRVGKGAGIGHRQLNGGCPAGRRVNSMQNGKQMSSLINVFSVCQVPARSF